MKLHFLFVFSFLFQLCFELFEGQPSTSNSKIVIKELEGDPLKNAQRQLHITYSKTRFRIPSEWKSLRVKMNNVTTENWRKLCDELWHRLTKNNSTNCAYEIKFTEPKLRVIRLPELSKKAAIHTDVLKCICGSTKFFALPHGSTSYFILTQNHASTLHLIQYVTDISEEFHIRINIPDLNSLPEEDNPDT